MNTDIVKIFIRYLDTQIPFTEYVTIKDKSKLNTICFDLLSWLKLEKKREKWITEGKRTCLKPMEVKREYGCRDLLIQLVEKEPLFNELFEFNGKEFYFKDTVPGDVRSQIRADAFSMYNPQPIPYKRPDKMF